MNRIRFSQLNKFISLLLAILLLTGALGLPALATEVETEPAETEAETTEAPETEPETEEPTTEATEEETTEPETEPPETTVPETTEAPKAVEPKKEEKKKPLSGIFHDVPLFLQTDYPKCVYGSGTVATSGCSMTSVAMVATYLTGKEILPDELAIRFREDDASNLQRMEAASIVLDLEFTKTFSWRDVVRGLMNGKIVTILVNSRSPFTKTQHFMVLTGITDDGKIMLNDPYGPNYQKWELKDGFENGFDQNVIMKGFSGAWIYEPYVEPQPTVSRYPDIRLTQDDRNLLAKIIWLEARGESFEGQRAVAEVVFNRMKSKEFSTETLRGTIMAENQFRTVDFLDTAKPGELQFKAIDKGLSGPYVLPEDVFFFANYPVNKNVWGTIGGHIFCKAFDKADNAKK